MKETTPPRRSSDDGLQPERTALAWSRTSLSILANGALFLLRSAEHYTGPLRLLPALLALVIAAATYICGQRRLAGLRLRPLPPAWAVRRQIQALGWAVIVLTVVTCVALAR